MVNKDPQWITQVDTEQAEIDTINRGSCLLRIPGFLDSDIVKVGDVPSLCYVRFTRQITDEEREQFKKAVLAISPLIEEIQLIGGLVPWKEFPGKVWKVRGEFGLRVEDVPVEVP